MSFRYKSVFNFWKLLVFLIANSCYAQTKNNIDFSTTNFDFVRMDTNTFDTNFIAQKIKYNSLSYEDISIGNRILLSSIPKEIINRNHITQINVQDYKVEKYDSFSNLIYEKYNSWENGFTYKYFYHNDNRPDYIIVNIDTIKYLYDSLNKLLNVGEYIIKYYPNGFKKSVENSSSIEKYEYDRFGNLCHINFDTKPVFSFCGNRTKEWFGKYDNNHTLIKDFKIGLPNYIEIYKYSNKGYLIQSVRYDNFSKEKITFDYIYSENCLMIKLQNEK